MTKKRLLLLCLVGLLLVGLMVAVGAVGPGFEAGAAGPDLQSGVGFRGWVSCITVDPASGSCVYALGRKLDLDADEDTSITADTDDQIDYELGGADIFVMREWGASSIVTDTTEHLLEILDTTNVMTGGTNSLAALNIDLGIGNSTGGTNSVYGILIDNIVADAQNTETAFDIAGTGWDIGIGLGGNQLDLDADDDTSITADTDDQIDYELGGADIFVMREWGASSIVTDTTEHLLEILDTTNVMTGGTNVLSALNIDLGIGNSTGGTNNVYGILIDGITNDAQVVGTAISIGDEWDYAIDTGLPIVASAMYWFDDFIGDEVMGQYTAVSGADGQAVQGIVEEQFGVYQLTSGDAGTGVLTDTEGIYLSLEWQADQGSLVFETRLHLDTDIATVRLCAGFVDDVTTVQIPFTIGGSDVVTSVVADGVMFCYDTGADTDEWFALGVANTTDATGQGATGTAPVADVYQVLRIEIDDGGDDCRFYIDGALVKTITADCITVTDALAPGVVIGPAATASSHVVDVDYILSGAGRD